MAKTKKKIRILNFAINSWNNLKKKIIPHAKLKRQKWPEWAFWTPTGPFGPGTLIGLQKGLWFVELVPGSSQINPQKTWKIISGTFRKKKKWLSLELLILFWGTFG